MSEERGEYRVTPSPGAIRSTCFLDYNEGYTQPNSSEVREMMTRLGMSGSQVASFVGAKNSRTVRRWCADPDQFEKGSKSSAMIPYACWRLLCLRLIEHNGGAEIPMVAEELRHYSVD